ncbi:transcriptional regulator [Neiella marina]|uniref:Transcriptional regulator n=1 Tax=Neiella marina TaxID=508461 RepID=A0A8J2U4X2_9GAMM|nr:metalloregulator ArsR/SmtB family transcription factor [Neiella marina]GGA76234.1 transcriptional regulator [Neiella marina]
MKTTEEIVNLLKTNGPMTAQAIADVLNMTSMGARQHLLQLEQSGDLGHEDRKAKRGRPTRYWFLSSNDHPQFADRHNELTLQLIDSVKEVFGEEGLSKLIESREKSTEQLYQQQLAAIADLTQRVEKLAEIRTTEGYMATVEEQDGAVWLLENHCPICAAATACQGFCRSELELFQSLFSKLAEVSRQEHIVTGARRCAYRFLPR